MARFKGTIVNNSSFHLYLVEKNLRINMNILAGDRQRWQTDPPENVPPGATINPFFECFTPSLFEDVNGSVKYEGREGDTTLFELVCSWAVYWSPQRAMARYQLIEKVEKPVNCYQKPEDKNLGATKDLTVTWTLRDWPD